MQYLKDYVDLQQLRQQQCKVSFTLSPGLEHFCIEPLLLVPFVENSFKHLSHHQHKKNEVIIDIGKANGSMTFCISNTTENYEAATDPCHGIGLNNVKRRLELLYPKRHQLKIDEAEGRFMVKLEINVEEQPLIETKI